MAERLDERDRCLHCVYVVMDFFLKSCKKSWSSLHCHQKTYMIKFTKTSIFLGKKMVQSDHQTIKTLKTHGFTELDLTLIFKIITHFSNIFINPPTRGWSSDPQPDEITVGDDAQRLRLTRNFFFHKFETRVTEEECNDFFKEVIEICKRVDTQLNLPKNESLTTLLQPYLDPPWQNLLEIEEKYKEQKSLKEFLVVKVGERSYSVYQTGSLRNLLKDIRDLEYSADKEEMEPITLTFPEVKDPELVKHIKEELKDEINDGLNNIKLEGATEGSLVLELFIKRTLLLNEKELTRELEAFLRRLLTHKKLQCLQKSRHIVLSESYDLSQRYSDETDIEGTTYTGSAKKGLKLHLGVKRSILQSDEAFKGELQHFLEIVESKSNGSQIFKSNAVKAILEHDTKTFEPHSEEQNQQIYNSSTETKKKNKPQIEKETQKKDNRHNNTEIPKEEKPYIENKYLKESIPHTLYTTNDSRKLELNEKLPNSNPVIEYTGLQPKIPESLDKTNIVHLMTGSGENVEDERNTKIQLAVGDAIGFRKLGGLYKHRAIVNKIKGDRFTLIELNWNWSLSKRPTGRISKTQYIINNYFKKFNNAYVYKYDDESKRKDGFRLEEVAKILYREGLPKTCNILDFDSEHFVSYCITGQPFSKQTREKSQVNEETKEVLDRHIKIMKRLSDLKDRHSILEYWASDGGLSVKHLKYGTETVTKIKKDEIEDFLWRLEVTVKLKLKQKTVLEPERPHLLGDPLNEQIQSCCILPNGLVVILCSMTLKIYNSDLVLKSSRFLKLLYAKDVTPVDNQSVAVSSTNCIYILNVDSNEVEKRFYSVRNVIGLCCSGRDIVCCVKGKGLVRVNIDSQKVKTLVEDESVSADSHVVVSSSLICYTCPDTNTATVLDAQYNVLFAYKDEAVLRHPMGVTKDEQNNIYVTGWKSNNLVVISPDGRSCHQLLGKDDGLDNPTAVYYSSHTKTLVLANWRSDTRSVAYIYSVELVSI